MAQHHDVHLEAGSNSVNVGLYRQTHFQKNEIERIVKEMLSQQIIRESSSPFSSPIILVKKEDGSWTLCVDFRA